MTCSDTGAQTLTASRNSGDERLTHTRALQDAEQQVVEEGHRVAAINSEIDALLDGLPREAK